MLFGDYSIPFLKEGDHYNLLVSLNDCQRLKKATLINNQELKTHLITMDENKDEEETSPWEVV